jgi:hypothetical protein
VWHCTIAERTLDDTRRGQRGGLETGLCGSSTAHHRLIPAPRPSPARRALRGLVDLRPSSGRLAQDPSLWGADSPARPAEPNKTRKVRGACRIREAQPHEADTPPPARLAIGELFTPDTKKLPIDGACAAPAPSASHAWRVVHAPQEEVANRRGRLELPRRRRLTHGELFTPDTKKSPIDGAPRAAPTPAPRAAPAPRPTARPPTHPSFIDAVRSHHPPSSMPFGPPPAQGGRDPRPRDLADLAALHATIMRPRHKDEPGTRLRLAPTHQQTSPSTRPPRTSSPLKTSRHPHTRTDCAPAWPAASSRSPPPSRSTPTQTPQPLARPTHRPNPCNHSSSRG